MHFSTGKRRSWMKEKTTAEAGASSSAAATTTTAATSKPSSPAVPPRNPARIQTSVPLISVSEQPPTPGLPSATATNAPIRPPPSAFRNYPLTTVNKGKERQREPDLPKPSRAGWAQWVVDPLEARRGADVWSQGERVVLVLGEPTVASLAPMLYSSAFADTLILVGSINPLPEIEALTSPSHLMSLGDGRTIYPTIQPFQPPMDTPKGLADHPLLLLLKQATVLAEAHRQSLNPDSSPPSRPTSWGSRSRRGSSSTTGTMTPPTPQQQSRRFGTWGRRSAASSPLASPSGSQLDLSRLQTPSMKSKTPSIMSVPASERPRTIRRMASFFGKEDPRVCEGSPFDAVIDFIPPAKSHIDQQRLLHDMLQHATVLTTAVLPILTTAATANSMTATKAISDLSPLTLLHIVPSDAPPALAPVIERFLAPLLPVMAIKTRRQFFGCVTGLGPWMSTISDTNGEGLPAAETLLFGGLRSFDDDQGLRSQVLLSSWDQCVTANGTLVEASQRDDYSPAEFSRRASSQALSELRSASHSGAPLWSPVSRSSPSSPSRTSPPRTEFPLPATRIASSSTLPRLRTQVESPPPAPLSKSGSFTSRFDPRNGTADLQAPISLTSPTVAASVPRSPSGLRNSLQPSYQTSPPTPELDPSTSSCSSSSVLEPPPEERSVTRSIPSAPNGKPVTPSPSITKSRGFGSIFRRARGIKA